MNALSAGADHILVGPETADDAGVYLLDGQALVATTDLITPVCDDGRAFGRVAAANSLSDVYAMGGEPLFVLNICCFPAEKASREDLAAILRGGAETVLEAGAALLGGHSVRDEDLKYGLAVVGRADPGRLLTNAAARPGDQLLLSKPLGTGVVINAYRLGRIGAEELQPALDEMQRLNAVACRLALEHGVRSATDITGFGLVGHTLGMARASGVGIRLLADRLPMHEPFESMARRGVSTLSTPDNERNARAFLSLDDSLDPIRRQLLFDPQTSGGLLLSTPPEQADALLEQLLASGHGAAHVGEVLEGEVRIEAVAG